MAARRIQAVPGDTYATSAAPARRDRGGLLSDPRGQPNRSLVRNWGI